MDSEGCWSTVVSSAAERRALKLPPSAGWMLECRLPIGHRGNHATDGSLTPRHDRRFWLEWNDFDPRAQSLIERNPCPVRSLEGAPCRYFHGHPGQHVYARSNGHAPTAMSGMAAGGHGLAPTGLHSGSLDHGYAAPLHTTPSGPATGDLPVTAPGGTAGSHRTPDSRTPEASGFPPGTSLPPGTSSTDITSDSGDYRGGRRSTDSAPPTDQSPYQGRRHSFDDASAMSDDLWAPDPPRPAPTPPTDVAPTDVAPTDVAPTSAAAHRGTLASEPASEPAPAPSWPDLSVPSVPGVADSGAAESGAAISGASVSGASVSGAVDFGGVKSGAPEPGAGMVALGDALDEVAQSLARLAAVLRRG